MNKYIRFMPLALLVIYIVFKVIPYMQVPVSPSTYEPTSTQIGLLNGVIDSLSNYPDAAEDFGNLYDGMVLVVSSDEVVLKTTDDVRRAHENAGAIAIQVGEIPRIPGYAKAVSDFITSEAGNENVPLDEDKKKKIIEAFKALSWATNQ